MNRTVQEIGETIALLCARARYRLTLAQAQLVRAQATLISIGAPDFDPLTGAPHGKARDQ